MKHLDQHKKAMYNYRKGDRSPESKAANSAYQREYYQKRKLKFQKAKEQEKAEPIKE